MQVALLAGSPLSSREHTFSPITSHHKLKNALQSKNLHWRSAYMANKLRVCLTLQSGWIQPLWKYCQSKTHLKLFSLHPKSTFAFNSSPPILSPCPLACLPYVFTESLPSLSLTPQPNFHFLNYLYPPSSLLVMHFLMWLSLPGITTFYQVYYRFLCTAAILNTHQMCIPFQNEDHFSETGMQWCKQTADWSGYDASINSYRVFMSWVQAATITWAGHLVLLWARDSMALITELHLISNTK